MSGGVPDGCFDVGAGRGVFSTMEECKAACGKRPALPPSAPPSTGPKNWVCQTLPNGTRSCGYLAPDDGRRPPNFQGGYSTYEECLASGCGSGGGAGGGGGGGGGIGIGNPGAGGSSRPPLPCITYWNNNSRPPQFVQIGDCPPNGGGGGQRPGFPGGGGGGGRPIFPGVQPPLRPQTPTQPPGRPQLPPNAGTGPIRPAVFSIVCHTPAFVNNPDKSKPLLPQIRACGRFTPLAQSWPSVRYGTYPDTEEGYNKCLEECGFKQTGPIGGQLFRPKKCVLVAAPVGRQPNFAVKALAAGEAPIVKDPNEMEWTCKEIEADRFGKFDNPCSASGDIDLTSCDECNKRAKALNEGLQGAAAIRPSGPIDKPCQSPKPVEVPIIPKD